MHGVLAALVVAEEIDPATVRPSPLGTVVFVFLLGAMILLLWSFLRHLRRVDANLGPARTLPAGVRGTGTGSAPSAAGDAPLSPGAPPESDRQASAGLGDPGSGEGDSR